MQQKDGRMYTVSDDEIDLSRFWVIFRRRWKMIVGVSLLACVVAYIGSGFLKKRYAVSSIISLGRIEGGIDGKYLSLATVSDVQQAIQSPSTINGICKTMNLELKDFAASIRDGIAIEGKDGGEKAVLVYKTSEPEKGISILEQLITETKRAYNSRAEIMLASKDMEIKKLNKSLTEQKSRKEIILLEINQLESQVLRYEKKYQVDINVQTNELENIRSQRTYFQVQEKNLIENRNKLMAFGRELEDKFRKPLPKKPEKNIAEKNDTISGFIQDTTQLQIMNLLTLNYQREKNLDEEILRIRERIYDLDLREKNLKESLKDRESIHNYEMKELKINQDKLLLRRDKEIPASIEYIQNEIAKQKTQKALIEPLQVINRPDYLDIPIGTRRLTYVMIAGVMSLILTFGIFCVSDFKQEGNVAFDNVITHNVA
jgi:hypothetical protein